MGGQSSTSLQIADIDVLLPEPIRIKIGRAPNFVEIEILELVLKQYNQLFKIFGGILTKVISSGSVDFKNLQTSIDWKGWLPQLITDAGDDINKLLVIALDREQEVIDQITMKQLPEVLTAIIEVNGLEQIILGFQRLSAIVLAEITKQKLKRQERGQ